MSGEIHGERGRDIIEACELKPYCEGAGFTIPDVCATCSVFITRYAESTLWYARRLREDLERECDEDE